MSDEFFPGCDGLNTPKTWYCKGQFRFIHNKQVKEFWSARSEKKKLYLGEVASWSGVEVKRRDPGGWRGAAVSGRVVFGMIGPFCKEEREKHVSPCSALTVTFPEALRPMPLSTLLVEVEEIIVTLRLAARFLACFCHPALEPCASRLSTTLL